MIVAARKHQYSQDQYRKEDSCQHLGLLQDRPPPNSPIDHPIKYTQVGEKSTGESALSSTSNHSESSQQENDRKG